VSTVETGLCPGSGRFATWVRRGRGINDPSGECPECQIAVALLTHPDGGPEGVLDKHPKVTP
jgi:hypothetical protein